MDGVDRIRLAQLLALPIRHIFEGFDRTSRCDEDHAGHDKQRRDESRDGEQDVEVGHSASTTVIQKPPAARIDGTHSPTKRPSSR
jgi:hypothetical protein